MAAHVAAAQQQQCTSAGAEMLMMADARHGDISDVGDAINDEANAISGLGVMRALAGDEKKGGPSANTVENLANETTNQQGAVEDERDSHDQDGKEQGSQKESEIENQPPRKLKYPKSVFFIIGNEFCERFSFYDMRSVLTLYLTQELLYSEDAATVIFHAFVLFCYFTPLFGAVLADSYWGKFKTILYLSILYALGNITLSISAVPISGMPQVAITLLGLTVIAIGTGGIKPCVAAFGGDQFVLPEQEAHLQRFFAIFYMSINAGSLISMFLTPVLRQDVQCFGNTTCYPLAFGVPAIFMVIALLLFIFGKSFYTVKKPEGNIVLQVTKCMAHAISNKRKGKDPSKSHWLDYASDTYDQRFINDIKGALRVLVMYLPLPIFWALFDQQGSRWTFQATRMNGAVTQGYTIHPDQIQVLNPLLVLIMIPTFESIIYPLANKVGVLKPPLQKMVVGMSLAGFAFIASGILELKLNSYRPAEGQTRLTFMNTLSCPVTLQAPKLGKQHFTVPQLGTYDLKNVPADTDVRFHFVHASCLDAKWDPITVNSGTPQEAYSVIIHGNGLTRSASQSYSLRRSSGFSMVRLTHGMVPPGTNVTFRGPRPFSFVMGRSSSTEYYDHAEPGRYTVWVNGILSSRQSLDFLPGSIYDVALAQTGKNEFLVSNYVDTQPTPVHILWQLPQYILLTGAEIMFSPTGLEFSFTQSPLSMKSLIQSCWLLTMSFGNLIVMVIAEAKIFQEQYAEFFLFAGLIFGFAALFAFMAWRYKYQQHGMEQPTDDAMRRSIATTLGEEGAATEYNTSRRGTDVSRKN